MGDEFEIPDSQKRFKVKSDYYNNKALVML